jgi:hypothetical protein
MTEEVEDPIAQSVECRHDSRCRARDDLGGWIAVPDCWSGRSRAAHARWQRELRSLIDEGGRDPWPSAADVREELEAERPKLAAVLAAAPIALGEFTLVDDRVAALVRQVAGALAGLERLSTSSLVLSSANWRWRGCGRSPCRPAGGPHMRRWPDGPDLVQLRADPDFRELVSIVGEALDEAERYVRCIDPATLSYPVRQALNCLASAQCAYDLFRQELGM